MKIEARSQLLYLRVKFCEIALACQPLWHPLGFVSCVIRRKEGEYTTRLHLWPKYERRTKSPHWPIHNHVYDLASCVLSGRVRDTQYRLKDGSDYAIYSVRYSGENSVLGFTNRRTSIEKVIDEVHEPGEEYSVSLGSFHQTKVPIGESAITIVVLSNFVSDNPLVLGAVGEQKYQYDRAEFDKSAFWAIVDEVIHPL